MRAHDWHIIVHNLWVMFLDIKQHFTSRNTNVTRQTGRQCTYNVILRRISFNHCCSRKQWVLHNLIVCISSLRYPACKAHAPYCHLWPAPLYNIFPHYLKQGTIFEKKITEHKMRVLIFSTKFFWNNSHSKKKWAKCDKNVYWSSCKVPFILFRF